MQGGLQIVLSGHPTDEWAYISAVVLFREESGEYRHVEVYHGKRVAQDLTDRMSVEAWALATIAEHTDAIKEALAMKIERGSRTLISEVPILKKDL